MNNYRRFVVGIGRLSDQVHFWWFFAIAHFDMYFVKSGGYPKSAALKDDDVMVRPCGELGLLQLGEREEA